MRGYRRRRFLVDRFQYQLLAFNLLYLSGIIAVLVAAILGPIVFALHSSTTTPEQLEAASSAFLELHKRIWPAAALSLVLVSIHSILVSHRIAGPLFRFRKVFAAVTAGDLGVRAGVREKDYLRRDAEAINDMLGSLESRIAALATTLDEVRTTTEQLDLSLSDIDASARRTAVDALQTRIDSAVAEVRELRFSNGAAER